jgi:TolB protein
MRERHGPLRVLDRLDPPDLWPEIRGRTPRNLPSPRRGPRFIAAAVALAVAAAGVAVAVRAFPPGSAHGPGTATSASTDKIAFAWYNGSSYQIYTASADGADIVQVTRMPISVSNPTWSPDGTRIAFQGETIPGEGGRLDIYVANADGTDVTRLTDGPDSYQHPSWSPDGEAIAATRWSASDGHGDVVLLNVDGSGETALTRGQPGDSWGPVWSPDGTRLTYVSNRDANGELNDEIHVVSADGTNPTDVTNSPAYDRDPTWSPDGTKIAFFRGPEGSPGMYVMEADGSDVQEVVPNVEGGGEPTWSRDGTVIAFVEDDYRLGTGRLEVVDLATRTVRQLVDLVGVGSPAWQPSTTIPAPSPTTAPAPSEPASVDVRVTTTDGVAPFPSAVAAGEGGVWVTSCCEDGSGAGDVIRLDPTTGAVVARIPVRATPGWDFGGAGLTLGGGSVWTVGAVRNHAGCCDALVTRIDPATNSVIDEITVPGMSEGDLWVDGPSVYVLGFTASKGGSSIPLEVAKVDATSHAIEWQTTVPGQWSQTVFVAGGSVWVLGTGPDAHGPIEVTTLYRIDPGSGAVVDQIPLPESDPIPVVYQDAVWFRTRDGVQRFDPVSGSFVGDPVSLGPGCCGGPFVSDGAGGVWVVSSAGADAGRSIWHIDGSGTVVASGRIEDRQAFDEMQGQSHAFDPSTETIWSQHYKDSVSRVEILPA